MQRTITEIVTVTWTTRPLRPDWGTERIPHTARVQVEIDIDKIAQDIGTKAARNTSGRSRQYGGYIRAKRIR